MVTVYVDVTDTLRSPWRAGIQRVLCRLVDELRRDPRIDLQTLVWSGSLDGFRRTTPDEEAALAPGAAPPPAVRSVRPGWITAVRRFLRPVRAAAVSTVAALRLTDAIERCRRAVRLRSLDRWHVPLAQDLAPGSVLLEVDSVWNLALQVTRQEVYERAHRGGVSVAVVVYDLLPVLHPEWFEVPLVDVFTRTLRDQASGADVVFAISTHTATTFTDWAESNGLKPPTAVIVPLGADLPDADPDRDSVTDPSPTQMVLTVGTVEPRKNHRFLLSVMEQLWNTHDDVELVVVGRPGWNNEEVLDLLRRHPRNRTLLRWYDDADDELLASLYSSATVVAVPSITEGYGLPVIEALQRGVPVVCSDGGALGEAAAGYAEVVPVDDQAAWVSALDRILTDREHLAERREAIADYRAPSWSDMAHTIVEALAERSSP